VVISRPDAQTRASVAPRRSISSSFEPPTAASSSHARRSRSISSSTAVMAPPFRSRESSRSASWRWLHSPASPRCGAAPPRAMTSDAFSPLKNSVVSASTVSAVAPIGGADGGGAAPRGARAGGTRGRPPPAAAGAAARSPPAPTPATAPRPRPPASATRAGRVCLCAAHPSDVSRAVLRADPESVELRDRAGDVSGGLGRSRGSR
jgi:hypothetical protein